MPLAYKSAAETTSLPQIRLPHAVLRPYDEPMDESAVRIDPRVAIPIALLGVVVLAIMFVELCGREDVSSLVQEPPSGDVPPATLGPTFTPGPSPTLAPVVPTDTPAPQPGGQERDIVRVQDLVTVQSALEEVRADTGSYPSNEGTIQTLCVFTEFDRGCELLDVLDEIPIDPLEDASVNGYWYVSDGDSYTLYSQREGGSFPECLDHPEFLQDIPSLLCFSGP